MMFRWHSVPIVVVCWGKRSTFRNYLSYKKKEAGTLICTTVVPQPPGDPSVLRLSGGRRARVAAEQEEHGAQVRGPGGGQDLPHLPPAAHAALLVSRAAAKGGKGGERQNKTKIDQTP